MKNLFDVMQGGNLGNIGQSLNSALGGKLDAVMKNAGGSHGQTKAAPSSGFGNVGTLLGSAAIGGVLGALFSGKKAKKMAKSAVLVGGTAAAGALAWNFYQKWAQNKSAGANAGNAQYAGNNQFGSAPTTTSNQFGDAPSACPTPAQIPAQSGAVPPSTIEDTTALILLEAMVFAARADGHIDEEEKAYIENAVESLFPDQEMSAVLHNFLNLPVDPMSLASKVHTPEEAQDLYRLSCAAIEIDSFMERSYLDGLAKALQLDEAQKNQLEKEAMAVRASMEE